MKRAFLLLLFITVLRAASPAQEMPVPVDIQHRLLTKILTFDRNLKSRAGATLTVGILYQKYYRTSLNVENELISVCNESGIQEVETVPLSCVPLPIQSAAGLDS
ncbi:MAG: hypothetical protein EPO24_12760, partial [Bacteroidetes bacterium]